MSLNRPSSRQSMRCSWGGRRVLEGKPFRSGHWIPSPDSTPTEDSGRKVYYLLIALHLGLGEFAAAKLPKQPSSAQFGVSSQAESCCEQSCCGVGLQYLERIVGRTPTRPIVERRMAVARQEGTLGDASTRSEL